MSSSASLSVPDPSSMPGGVAAGAPGGVGAGTGWHHIDDDECRRFQSSVELVGKRWSSGILLAVAQGAQRFTEVLGAVNGLSDRLLSQRLKELELAGLVHRSVIASTPVQVRYSLTPRGADLMRSLQPLVAWGQRWE